MLGRFLVFMTAMLFGPLFIEVQLYHPSIVLEHDPVAIVPLIVSPLGAFSGFLLLAADGWATAAVFGAVCVSAIATGVVGTAIHLALHSGSLAQLALDPYVWLGGPPVLVPLSFAAAGCLGLIPILMPGRHRAAHPAVTIARLWFGMAAVCALAGAICSSQVAEGSWALMAVVAALGLGSFGYAAEIVSIVYPAVRAHWAAH